MTKDLEAKIIEIHINKNEIDRLQKEVKEKTEELIKLQPEPSTEIKVDTFFMESKKLGKGATAITYEGNK